MKLLPRFLSVASLVNVRSTPPALPHLRSAFAVLMIAAAIYSLDRAEAFRWADNVVTEGRMAAAPREASGRVVFIGIDSRSLKQIATWPWPREVYADMIERLLSLGATEVFFDIDFSSSSTPDSDAALAAALQEAGGAVILPAFRQSVGIAAPTGETTDNLPLPAFQAHAWLASVNFQADPDGMTRRLPWGLHIAGNDIPSAASTISGVFGPVGGYFPINFAIMPETVPTYSVADLLEGRLDLHQIEGRSIIVGGHAAELGDTLSVPVHGVINGAILQALAAETLLQGIMPKPLRTFPVLTLVTILAAAIATSPLGQSPGRLATACCAVALLIEAGAFVLQARSAIVVHTPAMHTFLGAIALAAWTRSYGLQRMHLAISRLEARNGRTVLQRVFTDGSDAVVVCDEAGQILETSRVATDLFDLPDLAQGPLMIDDVLPPQLAQVIRTAMRSFALDEQAVPERGCTKVEVGDRTVHLEFKATPSRMEGGGVRSNGAVVCGLTVRDVTTTTEQRERLDRFSRLDPLTGALNRLEFVRCLEGDLRSSGHVVFALNLCRFKMINASLGRCVGDEVLSIFVQRIVDLDGRLSHAARVAGDTLAVACPGLSEDAARTMAEAMMDAVAQPFSAGGTSVRLEARIGIAFATAGADAATLLDHAEVALEMARRVAGGGLRFFEPAFLTGRERHHRLEHDLWSAIEGNEMYVLYQPQVDLIDNQVVGAEALVRWTHPKLGPISPMEFIPISESSGFIEALGRWALEQACREASSWPETVSVAVNVSSVQLQRGNLLADVGRALAKSDLSPSRLQLEVTESLCLEASPDVVGTLNEFRNLGVSLALDDFGSGYSSVGYLRSLPIDKLKLDCMFADGLGKVNSSSAIVRSVITLARDLGIDFICEGIETELQRDALIELGCPKGQGYLFGRPMTGDNFRSLVSNPQQA